MKEKPLKGDWIEKVEEDLKVINMSLSTEVVIKEMTTSEFKRIVKQGVRESAFKNLEKTKLSHDKVRHIEHTNLEKPQEYLNYNKLDRKQKQLLYNLRCRSENSFKDNFHKMYQNLDCPMCSKNIDSQEHALECHIIKEHLKPEDINILSLVKYDDIFGNIDRQVPITKIFQTIIKIRQKEAPHGIIVDQLVNTDLL